MKLVLDATLLSLCLLEAAPLALFVQRCSVCHGAEGGGADRGPALAGNRRLRTRSADEIASIIRKGTPGGMPGFALPADQVGELAAYVRALNATAFEAQSQGDVAAGESFLRGKENCETCHSVAGRGGVRGPDLSNIARQLTLSELGQSLSDPSARIDPRVQPGRCHSQ